MSCDVIVQWADCNTLLSCQMPFTSCHFINQLPLVPQANQLAAFAGRASACLLGWSEAAITPYWNTASTCSEIRAAFNPREKHEKGSINASLGFKKKKNWTWVLFMKDEYSKRREEIFAKYTVHHTFQVITYCPIADKTWYIQTLSLKNVYKFRVIIFYFLALLLDSVWPASCCVCLCISGSSGIRFSTAVVRCLGLLGSSIGSFFIIYKPRIQLAILNVRISLCIGPN